MTGGERPPISCYIRTLNEESRIGAAVGAAFSVAREVVAVDSGSTDGTVAAAEAAGARTVEQPWLGGGGATRSASARMPAGTTGCWTSTPTRSSAKNWPGRY